MPEPLVPHVGVFNVKTELEIVGATGVIYNPVDVELYRASAEPLDQ